MTEATKHDAAALEEPTGRTGAPVRVLVTVGTDHHQFDRLMTWIEAWIAANPSAAQVTVQHGYSRLPRGAEGFSMCSPADLLALNQECDVVVTQGGPGGVMDSLDGGIRPIVVARLVALDEVVDDHQVSFARHMSGVGLVTLASTAEELVRLASEHDGLRELFRFAVSEKYFRLREKVGTAAVRAGAPN